MLPQAMLRALERRGITIEDRQNTLDVLEVDDRILIDPTHQRVRVLTDLPSGEWTLSTRFTPVWSIIREDIHYLMFRDYIDKLLTEAYGAPRPRRQQARRLYKETGSGHLKRYLDTPPRVATWDRVGGQAGWSLGSILIKHHCCGELGEGHYVREIGTGVPFITIEGRPIQINHRDNYYIFKHYQDGEVRAIELRKI